MIQKTESYIEACKVCYRAIIIDLEEKGLNKANMPDDYPWSRRTLYTIRGEFMGKAKRGNRYVSLETFSKISEYFGISISFSLVFSPKGSPAVYPILENLPVADSVTG